MTGSLAFRTDLSLLVAQGADVRDDENGSVVRMRGNPAFRWGNFLLVPRAGEPAARVRQHAAAFPDAGFTTVGVDAPHPVLDEGAWLAAGFEVERHAVLVADRAPEVTGPIVRPLVSDADWAAETTISVSLDQDQDQDQDQDGAADPTQEDFARRRTREKRRLAEQGRAVWLGVEQAGEIIATAGIADVQDRTARFQDVQTAAAHRRQGCASALVAAGVRTAASRFGSLRFVLVAERGGPAIGLYRRLGFREVETQLQLTRVGGTVGGTA